MRWHRIHQRQWQQPQFQLHLVTRSYGRQELCLPTSSAAQLSSGKWCCVRCFDLVKLFVRHSYLKEKEALHKNNVLIYLNFLWTANLLNIFTFLRVCAQIDFCLLFSSARFIDRELHSSCSIIFYLLCCTYFSYHWRKIGNVSCCLTQISKRQRNPWIIIIHNFCIDLFFDVHCYVWS